MTDQPTLDFFPTPIPAEGDDALNLATYAQRAYLEYALSVVKGRALPDVCDGQKPVQRRILYAMSRMGLSFGGVNGNTGAKPVKCARVVGDVLGRFHPHGDQAAYDAYLEYALSVVKGRALPDVCDGQKPVQRRILYSMSRMGLGFGGANGSTGAKPVKCC